MQEGNFFPQAKKQLFDFKKYVKRKQYKYLVVSSQQKLTRLRTVHVICISMQEDIHRFLLFKVQNEGRFFPKQPLV